MSPPSARSNSQTTFRGVGNKARADEHSGRVRIISENGELIDVCTGAQLQRYMKAANAETLRSYNGRIRAVRLRSLGDERGHSPELHGNSCKTLLGHTPASRANPEALYHHK